MPSIQVLGKRAKAAEAVMRSMKEATKNEALEACAQALTDHADEILAANEIDMQNAVKAGMSEGLQDRLLLTEERLAGIAEGMRQVIKLPDPVGKELKAFHPECGLDIRRVSVPLGVIGIIYESRPNVTPDAFSLCFKAGNVSFLRGGSDCIHSNLAMVKVMREALEQMDINPDVLILLEDTSRETAAEMMKAYDYIDVLIPRGGAGLIKTVVNTSTIPVIETGTGNCHIYIDESTVEAAAVKIVVNAKTQRVGVCNACESLVVHEAVAGTFLPQLAATLADPDSSEFYGGPAVELRGDEKACAIVPSMTPATEDDWGTEYLDYILSVKVVSSLDEAIEHINRYHTGHSDAIISSNSLHSERFLNEIDSACVYSNASTRFTDGFMFGFGAEIGISTQKIHARGPMGLEALTSYKYQIRGYGQARE